MRLSEHVYSGSRVDLPAWRLSCSAPEMKYAIYKPSCLIWFVTMCKWNQHYNLLQAKNLPEGLTKPLMHALTSTVGVFGSDRGPHSSI